MLSFGSPLMLWWGLAAAIPFLLHLWNRKPRQILPFASTRFLLAAAKRQSRRLKVQQWILLLARVAMLLTLALALAEPRWGAGHSTMSLDAPLHHLLLLDDSYSMQTKVGGETRFDIAKSRFLELIRSASPQDVFSLVLMGDPAEALIAGPSHDRKELEKALSSLEVRPVTARMAPVLSLVKRLIDDAKRLSDQPRNCQVTIASDMARHSWRSLSPQRIESELASATVSLMAIGDVAPPHNVTITGFQADQAVAYSGAAISGDLSILNSGARNIDHQLVEIRSGDQVLYRNSISLAAGQEKSLRWDFIPQRGPLKLEARLDVDDLEMDNHRFLAIDVRSSPRLLCLAGSHEAAQHLMLALQSGPAETRPAIDLMLEGQSPADLSRYDAVMLLNWNTEAQFQQWGAALHRFVEAGGGILIGLGDHFPVQGAESAIYPAAIGPIVKVENPRLDPLEYVHPLLAAFRDTPEVGLLTLPVWRYRRLEKLRPKATVAARFASGDPALVEEPRGRGKIVLFASSLGAESIDHGGDTPSPWSGMPGSACYVPLIQEWVKRCATPSASPTPRVGDPAPTSTGQASGALQFFDSEAWRSASTSSRLDRPGVYRWGDKGGMFAANIDTVESIFESDRSRFSQWIEAKAPRVSPAVTSSPPASRPLAVWILVMLVMLGCCEMMLATLPRRWRKSLPTTGRVG